jgi:hypothetical protein
VRTLAAVLLLTASLYGQYGHQHFSWQEACFKNFALPYCQGHDFAIKPQPKGKNQSIGAAIDIYSGPVANVTPSEIVAGAIDWRFADPEADTLIGFRARKLAVLPMGRKLIAQLGANQGLAPDDIEKIRERLAGVEQVAISVGQNQTVVMITGRGSDSTLPPLEVGWKAVPVVGNAILVGYAAAVDQAVQRLTKDDPPSDMMRLAMKRQANSEFWAVAFGGLAHQDPGFTKVKDFSLEVLVNDYLTSDLALEFDGPPDPKTLSSWGSALKATTDSNVVHVSTTIEADQVRQKLSQIAANVIREHLTALVRPACYLPLRDPTVSKQAKPVIYGLN